MEFLSEVPIAIWIGGALALGMAWAIGANDVANAMGTSVGSGSLTIRHAVIIAAVFEFLGAFMAGGHVTDTVRKGMLDMTLAAANPEILLHGMLAALASAGLLLFVATLYGLPVSTTHSIVGAIIGFGVVGFGADAVNWGKVTQIVLSWLTSPLIGGALGFGSFVLIRRVILNQVDPLAAAKRWGPVFFFYVFFIIGLVTLFKGLKNLRMDFDLLEASLLSVLLGLVGASIGWLYIRRLELTVSSDSASGVAGVDFRKVERVFVVLQILTASAMCFAHGSNDVANAIGPLAAVVNIASGLPVGGSAAVSPWMLAVGGLGIVVGLATLGHRVIATVGSKITELTPSRGFAAELAAATTIVIASRLAIPVSTTHILVGSVLGVGLARGIGALDLRVVGRIMVSWVATLPIAAGLSIIFFSIFQRIL